MDSYYWCIFNNFRLYYYGSHTTAEVDGIDTTIADTPLTGKRRIYHLDGRQVAGDHLAPGIYSVDGKKIIVK